MNFSKTLASAVLTAVLLLTADLPLAGSPVQAQVPAPTELPANPAQKQQLTGRLTATIWGDHLGFTPARTQVQSGLTTLAGMPGLQATGNTALLVRPSASASSSRFRAKARAVLNKYGCSSSGIRLNDRRLGRYANGKADWYNNVVLLRSSMPASRVTYVTAHECMHMRQYRAYGGNVNKLAAAMNRIYGGRGFTGLERNADCMTRAVGIKVTNNAYASSCSGAKRTAALKVLRGKRA